MGSSFQLTVFVALMYVSLSLPLYTTDVERRVNLEKNLNLDSWWDCWKDSIEKSSEESDETQSVEDQQGDNREQDVRSTRKVNITLYKEGNIKRVGRDGKKKKKYLLATAGIAAMAASVATAVTIILPLALKLITFLAIKSFLVGKFAILMASFLGFLRLVQDQPEQKTVIYVHKPHKHPYRAFDLRFKPFNWETLD